MPPAGGADRRPARGVTASCSTCGRPVAAGNRFCGFCGAELHPAGAPGRASDVPWGAGDVVKATLVAAAIVAGLIVALAIARAVTGPYDPSRPEASDPFAGGEVLGLSAAMALAVFLEVVFLAVALWFTVLRRGAALRRLGFVRPRGRAPYLLALGAWLGGAAVAAAWLLITEPLGWGFLEPPESAQDVLDSSGGQFVVPLIVVGLLGPFCEEVFFRGFALAGFAKRFGPARAVVLSALLFGLFHLSPGLVVPTFIFGIVLGWLYTRTGSILPSIAAHSFQNILALALVS